jgi:hypothetical protein
MSQSSTFNKALMLVFYFLSFFLLTEFAIYYFPMLKIPYWALLSFFFVISVLHSKRLDKIVLIYFILFIEGVLISFLSKGSVNGTLLVPIFSYMCFYIQKQNGYRVDLSLFSNIIIIFLICFSLIELFVKLNYVQLTWMHDYLINSGSKRIDVLRLSGPFGSPLSLSALAVYLFFYSLYIRKNSFCFCGSIAIVLLSGSRTAFVICIILYLSTISLKNIEKKTLYTFFVIIVIICAAFYYANKLGLTHILSRVISLQSYNILRDESFLGRSNTTVNTALLILEQMPRTLFLPLNSQYISDSAIISLIAGSGLFLVMNFIVFLLRKISYLKKRNRIKLIFIFMIFLLAFMVGDAFVPAASFYLYSILYYKAS